MLEKLFFAAGEASTLCVVSRGMYTMKGLCDMARRSDARTPSVPSAQALYPTA